MSKKWKLSQKMRLLVTLELAIVLPAAALIAFSLINLHKFERDKAVDAAFQREFMQLAKIADKRLWKQSTDLIEQVRGHFPEQGGQYAHVLDGVLKEYPYAAHVFLFDEQCGLTFRSNSDRMSDWHFQEESRSLNNNLTNWMKVDVKEMVAMLRKTEKTEGVPYSSYPNWPLRKAGKGYQLMVFFTLPQFTQDRTALGGMVFDAEFLGKEFFPATLDTLLAKDLAEKKSGASSRNPVVMMLRPKKGDQMVAASAGWDGGKPEVVLPLDYSFPGLALAIKFQGTTIEALAQRFIRNNLWIIGGLSLLLAGGIFLTYRNVAKEMELARLKSDFVANVSHELRTPLALIRLYAETLEMGRVSGQEKFKEYYTIIRKESERLSALINNILDFSRIEAGKKEYNFSETNLVELVRNTLDSYRYQIEQQGFKYEESITDDLPPVKVDREAIARSLVNLVNNALKYSAEEKYLGVHLYRANGDVKLEVVDHGIGIPHGDLPRIFDKFYRAGNPLVHNTKGSGLGLSLVHHIVRAHGGRVFVESAPGKGSKFTIALPLNPTASGAQVA